MATTLFEFLARLVTLSFSAFAGGCCFCKHAPCVTVSREWLTQESRLNSWLHRGTPIEQSVASWTRAWQSLLLLAVLREGLHLRLYGLTASNGSKF